ncbi:MAG: undecaprenyl/decaprenyl-phosphate alpha-N-acetylglucosaminyl 1-phosphate transferase, partial [Bacteroidota bacterium]
MGTLVLCFITAFAVGLLSTPALIKVAYLKRLVDEPGEDRKLHKRRVPTIGGIIIFAATLFAYLMWYPLEELSLATMGSSINDFKYIGACILIVFFIGVKDDIIGMAPVKKLIGHLVVAFIL